MEFTLKEFKILRRRNKRITPCIPDHMNFDEIVLHDHLQNIGCKTPFQKAARTKTVCESKEQIKRANFDLLKNRNLKKACTTPIAINFENYETNYGKINGSDWFHIYVTFPDNYEEIMMVRAVDIHSAIGNSGGYIGLFLGYALLQLPDFIVELQRVIKNQLK